MDIYSILKTKIIEMTNIIFGEHNLDLQQITVESPKDQTHGDLSSNVAMIISKKLQKSPKDIALLLIDLFTQIDMVQHVDIAGPGFINFFIKEDFWQAQLNTIIKFADNYGDSTIGHGKRVNIDFVSTNPTGPMHIGHARGAVYGDALAKLLTKTGHVVVKEFYMNDHGGQIDILAKSLYIRYLEIAQNKQLDIPQGLYPGAYLVPVAQKLFELHGDRLMQMSCDEYLPLLRKFAVEQMMELIKQDLKDLEIQHDVFFSETILHEKGLIDQIVTELSTIDLVYNGVLPAPKGKVVDEWQPHEQLLFRSTMFGDDQDRALKKHNGEWTYCAADIAYTKNKIERDFNELFLVLGADHNGYIKRLIASTESINKLAKNNSKNHQKQSTDNSEIAITDAVMKVKICQLVNFIKDNEPVKMSKRAGNFTTVRDVIDEVGKDIIRFIMLTRKNDIVLDFDLDKVREQSKDNPVFYVQYAHVRTKSIISNAYEQNRVAYQTYISNSYNLELLNNMEELDLIKTLCAWPRLIETAAIHAEPHRITFYLQNLAAQFHSIWNLGKSKASYRFILPDNIETTAARLALNRGVQIILKNGLELLGVKPLEHM